MKMKVADVRRTANCWGCAFMVQISGSDDMLCSKYVEGEAKIYPHVEDVEQCVVRNSEVVEQLKEHQPRLGLGFLMTPMDGPDEGDCMVQLVSASEVLFKGKLSELFPNETFIALTTVRLFNESGIDQTDIIKRKALARAYDETPKTKNVFGSLLDQEE